MNFEKTGLRVPQNHSTKKKSLKYSILNNTMTKDLTVCDLIGNTPMIRIDRCLPESARENNVRVLLKMEMQNPGGSIKDRIAMSIIDDAEKKGLLKPGGTVVEYTSGNTGIGLAMVCATRGYKFICAMPQVPSYQERYIICRQFGAEVHLTAPAKGLKGLVDHVESLIKENPDYFLANQFYNEANYKIHYQTTGPEIWEQSGETVDYFISAVGTGGTVRGTGQYLTEKNPDCKIIAVEPTESRAHTGAPHKAHSILGIGAGIPTHFLTELVPDQPMGEGPRGFVSEFAHATSEEAIEFCLKLSREEGIMTGPSTGANIKVAFDVAQRPEAAGKTIVVICASHGIRYTKHPLWAPLIAEANEALPVPPNVDPEAETLQWKSEDYTPAKKE